MLYLILIYLILYTVTAFYILRRDVFSPTVITGLTLVFGTAVACIGNVTWKIDVTFNVMLIYMAGTLSMLFGEKVVDNKYIAHSFRLSLTSHKKAVNIIDIPHKYVIILFIFSCLITIISKNKAVQIAYNYGYTGAEWQSLQVYVKHALMNGNLSYGVVLSLLRQFTEIITYIGIFAFVINLAYLGLCKTIKKYWIYLLNVIPYAYMLYIQGQRSNFIGIASFTLYSFFLNNYTIKKKQIQFKSALIIGGGSIALFYLYFIISGLSTGRIEGDPFESIKIYSGSAIVDFSVYLNSDMKQLNGTFGQSTFSGIIGILKQFHLYFPLVNRAENSYNISNFVIFDNGSMSNVYGPYASYYSDFGIIGVILLQFLLGIIYKVLYNRAKYNDSLWDLYLFSFISYGIVIAFINEQQLRLLFSEYQLVHLTGAYFILNYITPKFGLFKKNINCCSPLLSHERKYINE